MPPGPSNEPKETVSRFEKLLTTLARAGVDYAVVGEYLKKHKQALRITKRTPFPDGSLMEDKGQMTRVKR